MLDEAHYISLTTLKNAVLPVAQQNNTVVVGLTTPKGVNNPQSRFFATMKKDKSDTIFTSVRIGKPCDDCTAKKIAPCIHEESASPAGLSRKKRDDFTQFYMDDFDGYRREFVGDSTDSARSIFNPKWLLALAQRRKMPVPKLIDIIMVSIDPSNGGECEWGFCACYYDTVKNAQVILQVDAQRVSPPDPSNVKNELISSIRRLRGLHENFANIPIVIACEAAPKFIAEWINEWLQLLLNEGQLTNMIMMCDTPDNRPGVLKTNSNTQDMVRYCQLLMEQNQIYFSEAFNTNVLGENKKSVLSDFYSQLVNVKKYALESKNPNVEPKYRIDGKSGGKNDDRFVAWCMNYYHYYKFMISPNEDYARVRNLSTNWRSRFVTVTGINQYIPRQKRISYHDNELEFIPNNDTDTNLFPSKIIRASYVESVSTLVQNNYSDDDDYDDNDGNSNINRKELLRKYGVNNNNNRNINEGRGGGGGGVFNRI